MGWRTEFGGRSVDFDVPESIIRLEGLEDMSWKNDTCPSFGTQVMPDEIELRIWCEAPEPDDRQSGFEQRFMVQAYTHGTRTDLIETAGLADLEFPGTVVDGADHVCWGTDDPEVAVRIFITVLAHLQAAIAADRRAA
jgi:hypothetical protein